MHIQIKAAFLTVVIQAILAISLFIGFILDPLIGIWIAGIIFWVVETFFIYHFFCV